MQLVKRHQKTTSLFTVYAIPLNNSLVFIPLLTNRLVLDKIQGVSPPC